MLMTIDTAAGDAVDRHSIPEPNPVGIHRDEPIGT